MGGGEASIPKLWKENLDMQRGGGDVARFLDSKGNVCFANCRLALLLVRRRLVCLNVEDKELEKKC